MHILKTLSLLPALLLPLAACATALPEAVDRSIFDEAIAPWQSDEAPGVAMAVMMDGEVVFAEGAGLAHLGHGVPIGPVTVFHAASLTKQVTAFAVLSLVAERKIGLGDDIRQHIPELSYRGPTITVAHLLDHMSGLREASTLAAIAGWRSDDVFTETQRLRLIEAQTSLNFIPGEKVEYSNSGYALLAEMVARVSGQSFRDYADERIFTPLGMDRTLLRTDLTEVIRNRAEPYAPVGDGYAVRPLNYELVGSTGLQTTVLDLLRWADALNDREIGSPRTHRLLEARTVAGDGEPAVFGRGQELRSYRGLTTWSHGGTDAGYRSFLLRIPAEDFAIAILSNRSDFDTAKLAFSVVDEVFFGGPQAPVAFAPASPEELGAYAGLYEIFPGLIFSITTDGESLFFAPRGVDGGQRLEQVGERAFLLDPSRDLKLVFDPARDGRSDGFGWTIGLHGVLPAKRITLEPFDPAGVQLQEYVGSYFSPELGVRYRVSADGETLRLEHHRLPDAALSAYQQDTFAGSADVRRVVFVRDRQGAITGALFSGALANDILFERQ